MGFPTNVFVSGHANPVQFQVIGQGSVATLNITQSSWDEEINAILVTHSGSGVSPPGWRMSWTVTAP